MYKQINISQNLFHNQNYITTSGENKHVFLTFDCDDLKDIDNLEEIFRTGEHYKKWLAFIVCKFISWVFALCLILSFIFLMSSAMAEHPIWLWILASSVFIVMLIIFIIVERKNQKKQRKYKENLYNQHRFSVIKKFSKSWYYYEKYKGQRICLKKQEEWIYVWWKYILIDCIKLRKHENI